jgi:hypothetical protein
MTDYKNEYQKYADKAVKDREREEGFGRLRLSVFLAAAGPMANFLAHVTHFEIGQRWMALALIGLAPLSVVLLIINYIRLPNDAKASGPAILILFMTLLGAGANFALANILEPSLMKVAFPN